MPAKKKNDPAFEEALSELEVIISQLERDDLTLDNALLRFEEGIRLMRACDTHLKNAQGKLKELIKSEDGEFIIKVLGENIELFTDGENSDG
ncbi:MAG: exodeoxyribonuclease VII small subunit [Chitinispirillales bacterium]|jgi:exodeoxyribonuclease VII small subunit|nr:exodeoxyribonuclease VII small subunit [Chitinispirillales bacterium]